VQRVFALHSFNLIAILLDAKEDHARCLMTLCPCVHVWPPELKNFQCYIFHTHFDIVM
jgi:hypothetical protein